MKKTISVIIFGAALLGACSSPVKNTESRPNILFIMSDDHAYAETVKEMTEKLKQIRIKYKDSEELDQHFIGISDQNRKH